MIPCCSVLQCGAVCCSVLQCVAVCCSVLQCGAVWCSLMQCVVVLCKWCSVLQYVAVCCSVLQCAAVCCSVMQCAVVWCSVVQCVAVCISASQCDINTCVYQKGKKTAKNRTCLTDMCDMTHSYGTCGMSHMRKKYLQRHVVWDNQTCLQRHATCHTWDNIHATCVTKLIYRVSQNLSTEKTYMPHVSQNLSTETCVTCGMYVVSCVHMGHVACHTWGKKKLSTEICFLMCDMWHVWLCHTWEKLNWYLQYRPRSWPMYRCIQKIDTFIFLHMNASILCRYLQKIDASIFWLLFFQDYSFPDSFISVSHSYEWA